MNTELTEIFVKDGNVTQQGHSLLEVLQNALRLDGYGLPETPEMRRFVAMTQPAGGRPAIVNAGRWLVENPQTAVKLAEQITAAHGKRISAGEAPAASTSAAAITETQPAAQLDQGDGKPMAAIDRARATSAELIKLLGA